MPGPENQNAAAPNNRNTLAAPEPRLPIGIVQQDPGGEMRWRVWVPARGGGVLGITHGGGATLTIKDPAGKTIASGAGVLSAKLATHDYGLFYVVSSGAAGDIMATFAQTGWSRESPERDAKPLIPYNFHFYPYYKQDNSRKPLIATLKRYAAATMRVGVDAGKWEDDHHARDAQTGWEGHCHFAAPASALFEMPGVKTTVSGPGCAGSEEFNAEEMKILAMEFFGSYGNAVRRWSLPGVHGGGEALESALYYLKPDDPRTKEALLKGMSGAVGDKNATANMEKLLALVGGEANLTVELNRAYGIAAAGFYRALVNQILIEGQPLISNLRGLYYYEPATGIWNHVLFYMNAQFRETDGSHDERDMTVECQLAANADTAPGLDKSDRPDRMPGDHLPADPNGSPVQPYPEPHRSRQLLCTFRLVFDGSGMADGGDPRSAWNHCYGLPSLMPIYAPTNLDVVTPSMRGRRQAPDIKRGNEVVGKEIVDQGFLKIRSRFR